MNLTFGIDTVSKALAWLGDLDVRLKEQDQKYHVEETKLSFSYKEGLCAVTLESNLSEDVLNEAIPSCVIISLENKEKIQVQKEVKPAFTEDFLNQAIDFKGLPKKVGGMLFKHNVCCMGDLLALTRQEFFSWKGAGIIFWEKLEEYLEEHGYSVGMVNKDWRDGIKTKEQVRINRLWTPLNEFDTTSFSRANYGRIISKLINSCGCQFFGDLLCISEGEVLAIPMIGYRSLGLLEEFIDSMDYEFNSLPKNWKELPEYAKQ